MKVVWIIVAIAVIFAVPPLRERAATAMEPVVEMLGPVGDFIANPVRRYSAGTKADHVLSVIESDALMGRKPPTDPDAFQPWMRKRVPGDSGLDPWGNPYWIQHGTGTITIGSDGPDGERGTADDVAKTAPN